MFRQLLIFIAIAANVIATPLRRDSDSISPQTPCPLRDRTNQTLSGQSMDLTGTIVQCQYKGAPLCLFHAANGSFFNGLPSRCPLSVSFSSAPDRCFFFNTIGTSLFSSATGFGDTSVTCFYAGETDPCVYRTDKQPIFQSGPVNCQEFLQPPPPSTTVAFSTSSTVSSISSVSSTTIG
ncbi:hypothetical protein DFH06DRAFT_1237346 [Mycena polygramma]|nr:hypothetical protein DFH06DRAFT_1237346 [Mycena polygramma]